MTYSRTASGPTTSIVPTWPYSPWSERWAAVTPGPITPCSKQPGQSYGPGGRSHPNPLFRSTDWRTVACKVRPGCRKLSVSWETPTGLIRADPVLSGVVVVRHGGQLGLRGDAPLIACMPYQAKMSSALADLARYLSRVRRRSLSAKPVGVAGWWCQLAWPSTLKDHPARYAGSPSSARTAWILRRGTTTSGLVGIGKRSVGDGGPLSHGRRNMIRVGHPSRKAPV